MNSSRPYSLTNTCPHLHLTCRLWSKASYINRLEELLTCSICSDFFRSAMSLNCPHSFCSECIRGHYAKTKSRECPVCHVECPAEELRINRRLEALVDAFQRGRARHPPLPPTLPTALISSDSDASNAAAQQQQKQQKGPCCPMCGEFILCESEDARTVNSHVDACLQGKGAEWITARRARLSGPAVRRGKLSIASVSDCISAGAATVDAAATPASKRRRMTKRVYSCMTDTDLKKLMKESQIQIPAARCKKTLRKAMIALHEEYVLLYNSESDALNPKSMLECAKEAFKRYEQRGEQQRHLASDLNEPKSKWRETNAESSDAELDAARKAYLREAKDAFEDLVANARKSHAAHSKCSCRYRGSVREVTVEVVQAPGDLLRRSPLKRKNKVKH